MRSAIALAALTAGAIAVPFAADQKRGLDYDVEVAYVTNIVTVTAYGSAPTPPAKAPHYGHKSSKVVYAPAPIAPAYEAPAPIAPVYEAPAPAYSAPAPVYQAPAPVYSAPAPVSSAPSSDAPSGDASTTSEYRSAVLDAHNVNRAKHSAAPLEWDDDLAKCAIDLASTCDYHHDVTFRGGGYGQNIAAGVNNVTQVISDMFYSGEQPLYAPYYGQEPDMSNFEAWGHFTQVVWKSTTHVACFTQECHNGLLHSSDGVPPFFTVCNYKGPGNYAGQYAANVLAPTGGAPGY